MSGVLRSRKPSPTLQTRKQSSISASALPTGASDTATTSPSKSEPKPASGLSGNEASAGYVLMPYPISANLYWRHFKGRTVVSKEAVAYKVRVANICRLVGMRMIEAGPVAVHILLHPRLTKKGEASLTRLDLGNTEKVLSDALNGIAWTDDKQLVRILLEVADPIDGGGVSISVGAA